MTRAKLEPRPPRSRETIRLLPSSIVTFSQICRSSEKTLLAANNDTYISDCDTDQNQTRSGLLTAFVEFV